MIPFSVEETFIEALMFTKSCGPIVTGLGFSTRRRSPNEREGEREGAKRGRKEEERKER